MLITPLVAILVLLVGGGAFAYWRASGSGTGSGTAGTTVAVTLSPGTAGATLYPGGTANVVLTATNTNASPVRLDSLSLDTSQGTLGFAVDAGHSGCAVSTYSYTRQTNGVTGWTVPGKVGAVDGTLSITLTNALAMGVGAANACQGASVTVYLVADVDDATGSPDTLGGSSLAAWLKADAIPIPTVDHIAATAKTVVGPEVAEWAVDGAYGAWTSANLDMPTWWRVQLTSAKVVTGYAIKRRDDIPNRNIKDFTFQGSNNGTTWTTLDTRTGITWPTAGQTQSFSFTNATAYSYYQVNITANNGDSYTSIQNITFVGATETQPLSDGAALTSWVDSSSKGNNLVTVSGTAPKYRASGGPLGLPYVDHTVAAGGLFSQYSAGLPTGDYTYFTVVQTGSTATQSLMNAPGGAGEAQIRLNNLKVEIDQSGTAAIKTSTAGVAPSTWTIILVTFQSVGSVVHFDIGGTIEDYSLGGTRTFVANGFNYGSYMQNSTFFNGKMAEIGLYSSVLSAPELADLKAYLTAKYQGP